MGLGLGTACGKRARVYMVPMTSLTSVANLRFGVGLGIACDECDSVCMGPMTSLTSVDNVAFRLGRQGFAFAPRAALSRSRSSAAGVLYLNQRVTVSGFSLVRISEATFVKKAWGLTLLRQLWGCLG